MQTLIKFKNFVDELCKENGSNYKKAILEKHKDDSDIRYFLNFICNPYIITGISTKKLAKKFDAHDYEASTPVTVDGMLNYLKVNNTGRDSDLLKIKAFEYYYLDNNQELIEFFEKIISKDFSIGVTATTINKVIPGLIPTFSVQLAAKYFEHSEYVEGKEFAITTKIDGMRCIMMKENGEVKFFSRQGQLIEGLVDLEDEAKKYLPDDTVLDGELVSIQDNPDTYKQTMKTARTKDVEKHGLQMMVFDCMDVDEFKAQQCTTKYHVRRKILNRLFAKESIINSLGYEPKFFTVLPILYQGTDTSKITEILQEQVAKGEEGIMINITDAPYHFARTLDLLKVKIMKDLDLEIVDYFEGDKKLTGMLGGFIVRYKDGNLVRVGSGFEENLRKEIWKDPKSYIGKIITVQYFEETSNDNGGISLRFPIFVDFREDKDEADY